MWRRAIAALITALVLATPLLAQETENYGPPPIDRKKFWNAVWSFGRYYPLPYYSILRENEEVYESRDCTPLLYTPGNAPGIYVNRFAAEGKTLFHLYNASGFTFDGIALAVSLAPDQHLFDLLSCAEAQCTRLPGKAAAHVRLYLPRNDVGCLARLLRRLAVSRRDQALTVTAGKLPAACRLAVADKEGRVLLAQPAREGSNTLDLGKLTVPGICLRSQKISFTGEASSWRPMSTKWGQVLLSTPPSNFWRVCQS